MRRKFWLPGTLALAINTFVLTTSLYAQLFGTGPSDPAQFSTVANIGSAFPTVSGIQNIRGERPLQVNVLDGSFGASTVEADVELNIDGGSVQIGGTGLETIAVAGELNLVNGSVFRLEALENSQVNILGGVIGIGSNGSQGSLSAQFGSEVNISGGSIASNVSAAEGSVVHVTGGNFGELHGSPGSDVSLNGGEFVLNGNPYTGESIELSRDDLFTGTLEDGSAFELHYSFFSNSPIGLNTVALPTANLTPFVVNSVNLGPSGLRAGQTMTLQEGGDLGRNFEVIDATLNVEGGIIGERFGAHRSEVTISSGNFGELFWVTEGSVVDISGGRFGLNNFSGSFFEADAGSVVNISGGFFGDRFRAKASSSVVISGGAFGDDFTAFPGTVELVGGEFKLNGEDYKGETFTLNDGDELTGTLADGSAFIFCGERFQEVPRTDRGDMLSDVTLTNVVLPEIDTTPIVVSAAFPDQPSGLRAGQTLTLIEGGVLEANFEAVDATLNIQGGVLGRGGRVTRSEVNISGGRLGGFDVGPGSRVNISGGRIEGFLTALEGSVLNIGGGELTAFGVTALAGSELNLFGSEFFLDGQAIDFQGAQSIEITEQGNMLSGTLSDGSSFEYFFNAPGVGAFISPDVTITVNLGSIEPILVGDVSLDGVVNFLDISPFISVLSNGGFQAEADIDGNGSVNFQDISPFIALLSAITN